MTAQSADDSTRLSERVRDEGDVTVLGTRGRPADATRMSERRDSDATRLSGKTRVDGDATRIGGRSSGDATVLSSGRAAVAPMPFHQGVVPGASASQIGVTATTVAYDPAAEGIVLTTYSPREFEEQTAIQPVPLPEGIVDPVSPEFLIGQAEVERRYDRSTNRMLVGAAALGVTVFGGAVAFLVVLIQGF